MSRATGTPWRTLRASHPWTTLSGKEQTPRPTPSLAGPASTQERSTQASVLRWGPGPRTWAVRGRAEVQVHRCSPLKEEPVSKAHSPVTALSLSRPLTTRTGRVEACCPFHTWLLPGLWVFGPLLPLLGAQHCTAVCRPELTFPFFSSAVPGPCRLNVALS